jgi:hypothetical protein
MPSTIRVETTDPGRFLVTITDGASQSVHTVSLSTGYYEKLTQKQVSQEVLIEQSFRFLLEHEPKESILREFDLPLISHYFRNYESEIRRRLGS